MSETKLAMASETVCCAHLSFGTSCPPAAQITMHTFSLYGFEEVLCLLAGI